MSNGGQLLLMTVSIQKDADVVIARRRATQIAESLGFDRRDSTRIATAVSEIVRNAFRYAGGGRIAFRYEPGSQQRLVVAVSDEGGGIANLKEILSGRYRSATGMGMGILGAGRLMDDVDIKTSPSGTTVTMVKHLTERSEPLTPTVVAQIVDRLLKENPGDAFEEIQRQNQDLLAALEEVQRKQEDLVRLNKELEDTNRGVVALYAELDERAERLRQADEIKSRFLSNMSHEFRTPLNSVLALSRLLLDRTDGDLTGEQEKQVTFIRKSAQDLTELVNDLLDLAKVEAGRTELNVTLFSVQDLLGALRGVLRPLLLDDTVTLVFEQASPTLVMESDEGKVAQILRNLVSNALKFTEHGSVQVQVNASRDGERVIFAVTDTGIGIEPENLAVIFEEFGQVRNRFQQRVKGTGLGLPLSRRLAELLGGTLSVESTPGVGSIFSIDLPRLLSDSGGPKPTLANRGDELPLVLVIDDEDATRYYISRMVAEIPYNVLEANSGEQGIILAEERKPDLILLDLIMPVADGYEVVRRLRTQAATAPIPIVVVTSKTLVRADHAFFAGYGVPILSKTTISRKAIVTIAEELLTAGATGHPPHTITDRTI